MSSQKRTIKKLLLREDWKFLNERLAYFPAFEQKEVKMQYKMEFIKGMDAEPNPVKQNNAGRRRANLWLLNRQ